LGHAQTLLGQKARYSRSQGEYFCCAAFRRDGGLPHSSRVRLEEGRTCQLHLYDLARHLLSAASGTNHRIAVACGKSSPFMVHVADLSKLSGWRFLCLFLHTPNGRQRAGWLPNPGQQGTTRLAAISSIAHRPRYRRQYRGYTSPVKFRCRAAFLYHFNRLGLVLVPPASRSEASRPRPFCAVRISLLSRRPVTLYGLAIALRNAVAIFEGSTKRDLGFSVCPPRLRIEVGRFLPQITQLWARTSAASHLVERGGESPSAESCPIE